MITTLLFDVDGVLLIGDSWNKDLASSYGITEEMLSPFFRESFPACLTGKSDLKEVLASYLTRWNWPHAVDDFVDYWFRRHARNEELLSTIQQFRQNGTACYLATQQEHYRTNYIWHTLGFAQLFDGIFSSVDIGYMKIDPLFFEAVVRELDGHLVTEMLFWDDQAGNVTTARSAGLHAEVYQDFTQFSSVMRTYGY